MTQEERDYFELLNHVRMVVKLMRRLRYGRHLYKPLVALWRQMVTT